MSTKRRPPAHEPHNSETMRANASGRPLRDCLRGGRTCGLDLQRVLQALAELAAEAFELGERQVAQQVRRGGRRQQRLHVGLVEAAAQLRHELGVRHACSRRMAMQGKLK